MQVGDCRRRFQSRLYRGGCERLGRGLCGWISHQSCSWPTYGRGWHIWQRGDSSACCAALLHVDVRCKRRRRLGTAERRRDSLRRLDAADVCSTHASGLCVWRVVEVRYQHFANVQLWGLGDVLGRHDALCCLGRQRLFGCLQRQRRHGDYGCSADDLWDADEPFHQRVHAFRVCVRGLVADGRRGGRIRRRGRSHRDCDRRGGDSHAIRRMDARGIRAYGRSKWRRL